MKDDPLTIIHGDALSSLRTLESQSVQCVVTSPPYWGLRDYGLEPSTWGPLSCPWEPAQCKHEWNDQPSTKMRWGGAEGASDKQKSNGGSVEPMDELKRGAFCECGAWRGQLGLEPTPELYVSHLVEIFREVKRVLRADGTLWLNLGDSYCTTAPGTGMAGNSATSTLIRNARLDKQDAERARNVRPLTPDGLKPKDLVGVPWRAAFALQADGWFLRSEVTWCKRSSMPESVKDRPSNATEKLFLLTKSERYLYNQDAVRVPCAQSTIERYKSGWHGNEYRDHPSGQHNNISKFCGTEKAAQSAEKGANLKNYWLLSPEPFAEAHFATFPTEIPRRCVLLGSNPGDVILDPFSGSGTTSKVAIELGRKAIAIEPKAEYVEMIKKRCQTTIGLPLAI